MMHLLAWRRHALLLIAGAMAVTMSAPGPVLAASGGDPRLGYGACTHHNTGPVSTTIYGRALRLEPAPDAPAQSMDEVWAAVRQELGELTADERRHTIIRYGLLTWRLNSTLGGGTVGSVPTVRRLPAWMVTNCVESPAPKSNPEIPEGKHGRLDLFFVTKQLPLVGDSPTHELEVFGSYFTYTNHRGINHRYGDGNAMPTPSPDSTPFYSSRWHFVRQVDPRTILVRYRPKPCWTLDHINGLQGGSHRAAVSVILSTGPDGDCPTPSGTQPFIKLTLPHRYASMKLTHGKVGKASFLPQGPSSSLSYPGTRTDATTSTRGDRSFGIGGYLVDAIEQTIDSVTRAVQQLSQ